MPATISKKLRGNIVSDKTVSVAKAKAELSALITRVETKQDSVTILRRGVPVAQIIPFPAPPRRPLGGSMAGRGRELGDIVSPLDLDWSVHEE